MGGGGLNKRGGPTDILNINKWGVHIKGGDGSLKNVLGQKLQSFITNECPIHLLIVEKDQYNFSCSRHLYIKQNRTFSSNKS